MNAKSDPFKAVGDSNADDTNALAKAYAAAAGTGRPLYLPPGVYRVTRLPKFASHATVSGAGADLTTVLYEGDETLLALANVDGVSIQNLGLWVTGTTGTAIELVDATRCAFDSVRVRGQHDADTPFRSQTGIVLAGRTIGTSFINCDIDNCGIGARISSPFNSFTESKFSTNYTSIWCQDGSIGAGLAISNSEFVSKAPATDCHLRIEGDAGRWSLTNVWFEGAQSAIVVGQSGGNGPLQFGMTNCFVSGTGAGLDIQSCRHPYLANVIFALDLNGLADSMLRIDPANAPAGIAINLVNSVVREFPVKTFPAGWTIYGNGGVIEAGGPTIQGADGRTWRITVSDRGEVGVTPAG
ncbi:glycosyl hydrolase family 28-related protein [Skermania sp. ID1734]|uniref:glycosyl hydrolase family 28-related protein n=1 Tax=Skermania sp. ID1734 TaxID=2597516 RepID=UPI00163D581A|nr:glycosyl hydrolase family 28-related protein [Skermania sp. ID1734]